MTLHCLVYVSTRRNQSVYNCFDELEDISNRSTRNNGGDGVTGILLAAPNRFVQYLEGERDLVFETYRRIARDQRHCHVTIQKSCALDRRSYGEWSMKVVQVENIGKLLYGVGDLVDDMDPYDLTKEALMGLVSKGALEPAIGNNALDGEIVRLESTVVYLD